MKHSCLAPALRAVVVVVGVVGVVLLEGWWCWAPGLIAAGQRLCIRETMHSYALPM